MNIPTCGLCYISGYPGAVIAVVKTPGKARPYTAYILEKYVCMGTGYQSENEAVDAALAHIGA